MYSSDKFIDIAATKSEEAFCGDCWESLAKAYELQALLVVNYDQEAETALLPRLDIGPRNFIVTWAFNVPVEPFNGADNCYVSQVIGECFKIHPKPHVHAIRKDCRLMQQICRHNRQIQDQHRMWFFPFRYAGRSFVFLGFPFPAKGDRLPPEFLDRLAGVIYAVGACSVGAELRARIDVTERYIKEVGHDFAGAVQATVAKLRLITDGRVTGENIKRKAMEIESEIWDSYRIAESLGIAIDSKYELRQPEEFDLGEVVDKVIGHFTSEANERHMKLVPHFRGRTVSFWGEKPAVKQAVSQLLSNAIKYGYGGTDVDIFLTENRDDIVLRIVDKGIKLPEGPDLRLIWDFGFRGREAKERHVNGSGIGLYTVKKIVTAHRGWLDAKCENDKTEFFIHFPKVSALKKQLGLLV